jgi:hypothetical protein
MRGDVSSYFALCCSACAFAVGSNKTGNLGLGDTRSRATPEKISLLNNVSAVCCTTSPSASQTHAMALCGSTIYSWGSGAMLCFDKLHGLAQLPSLSQAKTCSWAMAVPWRWSVIPAPLLLPTLCSLPSFVVMASARPLPRWWFFHSVRARLTLVALSRTAKFTYGEGPIHSHECWLAITMRSRAWPWPASTARFARSMDASSCGALSRPVHLPALRLHYSRFLRWRVNTL